VKPDTIGTKLNLQALDYRLLTARLKSIKVGEQAVLACSKIKING
jgi:hypothetical protein